MKNLILKAQNLSFCYTKDRMVLKNISLNFFSSSIYYLIGPNGSGKTTLLKTLAGLLKPVSGEVLFLNGSPISSKDYGFVFAEYPYIPDLKVKEIVMLGRFSHLGLLKVESKVDEEKCLKALELINSLHLENKNFDKISSGERQRVLIAMNLAKEPKILFLDEPFNHLDIKQKTNLYNLILKLQEAGLLTLISSHNLEFIEECSEVILLKNGEVIKKEKGKNILNSKEFFDTFELKEEERIFFKIF